MRMHMKKRQKLNNAGMTLVEILIAMAILSVAIVPLLFSFVNVAKYNARGRELQQTTVLAQTIIENCKAYSQDVIDEQMTNGTFLTGVDSSSTHKSGNTYYLQNVPAENFLYDVTLEFTSCGINESATASYDIMNTTNMNPYLDAVFTPQGVTDVTGAWTAAELDGAAYLLALEYIVNGIEAETEAELGTGNGVTLSTSYIESSFNDSSNANYGHFKIDRLTTIIIDDSLGYERVTVYIQYDFSLTSGSYTYDYIDAVGDPMTYTWTPGGSITIGPFEFLIYSNELTNDASHPTKIENIYFFYYPAYKNALSVYPFTSDEFVVSNLLSDITRNVNLYMIKQKNSAYTDTNLITLEYSYVTSIEGTGNHDTVKIFDNYNVNLGNNAVIPYDPSWYDYVLPQSGMIIEESKTLMYDLEVNIYEAGAYDASSGTIIAGSEPILTMDGTTLDW